jgi:hypothetical protein
MDVYMMVVFIVALSIGGGVANNYFKWKRAGGREVRELTDEIDALKARVATLEAIVTDPKRSLSAAIDELERTP